MKAFGTGIDAVFIIDFPGRKERPRLEKGLYFKNSVGIWYSFYPRYGEAVKVRYALERRTLDKFLEGEESV